MIKYGAYSYHAVEVKKMTEYLESCRRQKKIIYYEDAFNLVRAYGAYFGPHDKRLWDLLGLVSKREIAKGRPALSALVTLKSGPDAPMPGEGFFTLEKTLGRFKTDKFTTWMSEIEALFKD